MATRLDGTSQNTTGCWALEIYGTLYQIPQQTKGTAVNVLSLLAPSYGPLDKPALVYVDKSLECLVVEALRLRSGTRM